MKKILAVFLIIFILCGCNDGSKEKKNGIDDIFKDELVLISKTGDLEGKKLLDEITKEKLDSIFGEIFELAIFESHSESYGKIYQGAGSDGTGGRVFCCKIPVKVEFVGTKASIERFVKYFNELEEVVAFGDFDIVELEKDKYRVNTDIIFSGKAVEDSLDTTAVDFTIKKKEVDVEEEEEIVLRDFDVSMIIRPSNSDSSAISFGAFNDKDYRIYSSENKRKDVKITFFNEGNNYYCNYSIGDKKSPKVKIMPKGKILFDILSCDIEEKDDKIGVNLTIENNSNKKVSMNIYDDKGGRVKIINKSGNIEVNK